MLQTSGGETVTQNLAWRRQLGARQGQTEEVAVIVEISQPLQNGQERVWQLIKIPLNRTQFWEVRM